MQQISIARVRAEAVQLEVEFEGNEGLSCGGCLFQGRKSSILLTKQCILRSCVIEAACSFIIFGLFSEVTRIARRLVRIKERGYELALVWPDLDDRYKEVADGEALKLSSLKLASLKRFVDAQLVGS